MKILSAEQLRQADAYTIRHEPIASIDLMERASQAFVDWFSNKFSKKYYEMVSVVVGKGNNGGDGLAIARLLGALGYDIAVFVIDLTDNSSEDFRENLERLQEIKTIPLQWVSSVDELPVFGDEEILIDAILGSGLSRELSGELLEIVQFLNECNNVTVAVDIPTGVFADQVTEGSTIQADYTFSFELPKLSFFFPENYYRVGEFNYASIGLDRAFIRNTESKNYFLTQDMVESFMKRRGKFAHKGVFGHALLIMGSYGKMGAAILATRACLRAGVGLVTVHVPTCGYDVMQTAVPEAMVSLDEDEYIFTRVYELHKYSVLGLGCGLSTKNKTRNALCYVLKNTDKPTILDADALNILGQSRDWLEYIPKDSILTPHPKEFERLFGKTYNNFERNRLQRQKAQELGVYIVLKGANSCIATPDGTCYFNSTGNPGMGTAGSGDVLTGILVGLLAQGYTPEEAVLLGVYLHGLAGDLAAIDYSQEGMTAGDIVDYLGKAFLYLQKG
ncbi:MAG: NAD(P)H-hydrate dehydratase [Saprospiraceae bacterium]|nr:NAD(P)H-hydrate dehydratase [Saprospiraceae bacterium]